MLTVIGASLLCVPSVFSTPQAGWRPACGGTELLCLSEEPRWGSVPSRPVADLYHFQQDEHSVGEARGGGSSGVSHILFL